MRQGRSRWISPNGPGGTELLLEANADALSAAHPYKMTPLHLAAMGGHEAVVDAGLAEAEVEAA